MVSVLGVFIIRYIGFLIFFVHFQVPVGVTPKHEMKREEMVEIMDELQQKYTPCTCN